MIVCTGMSGLTSDAGWGCTLRSGQMLLAEVRWRAAAFLECACTWSGVRGCVLRIVPALVQGLLRHMMGRSWRVGSGAGQPSEMGQLLRWLHDKPRPESPFSVHNLCSAPGVHGWGRFCHVIPRHPTCCRQ
jgi:Peptidase family C54